MSSDAAFPPSPYDWSSFERPMARAEARAWRASIRGRRSYFSFLEIEHVTGLIVLVPLVLLASAPVLLLPIAVVTSLHLATSALDVVGGVALGVLVPILFFAAAFVAIRALIIPPRWRAWVRMARFAHENRIAFRVDELLQVPGTILPRRDSRSRIYGAFWDEGRKFTLGDYVVPTLSGRGWANWSGVILLDTDLPLVEGRLGPEQVTALLGDTAGGWQVDVEVVGDVLVAVKQLPFFTRRTVALQRAFALAIAMQSNSGTLARR